MSGGTRGKRISYVVAQALHLSGRQPPRRGRPEDPCGSLRQADLSRDASLSAAVLRSSVPTLLPALIFRNFSPSPSSQSCRRRSGTRHLLCSFASATTFSREATTQAAPIAQERPSLLETRKMCKRNGHGRFCHVCVFTVMSYKVKTKPKPKTGGSQKQPEKMRATTKNPTVGNQICAHP